MRDLSTEHESFIFDHVMNKYRPGMNPVRALYYEVREVKSFIRVLTIIMFG